MKKDEIQICILGAGNVAYHFCAAFKKAGLSPVQLYARDPKKASNFAHSFDIPPISDLSQIIRDADVYILAVSDNAIRSLANRLSEFIEPNSLVVHCSGAIPSSVLASAFDNYGVFYPLQTLKKDQAVDFNQIPICVHGALHEGSNFLISLAKLISQIVHPVNDEQRAFLHIAAVFANNFSNYLFQISHDLLRSHDLDFELLIPLIVETAEKVRTMNPSSAQTGPAVRGDQNTIDRHLQLLADNPNYQRIYRLLTLSINKDLDI